MTDLHCSCIESSHGRQTDNLEANNGNQAHDTPLYRFFFLKTLILHNTVGKILCPTAPPFFSYDQLQFFIPGRTERE